MKFLLGAMALSTVAVTQNVQAAENEGIISKCAVQEKALVKGAAQVPVSKCGQPFRYSTPEWKVEKDGSKVLYRDGKRALKWQAVDNTWVFIGDDFKPVKGWQVLPVVQQGMINVISTLMNKAIYKKNGCSMMDIGTTFQNVVLFQKVG